MESSDESFVWSRASTGSDSDSVDAPYSRVKVKAEAVKQESTRDSTERYLEQRAKREHRDSCTTASDSKPDIEDKFCAEETVVESRRLRTPSGTSTSSGSHRNSDQVAKHSKTGTPNKSYTSKEYVSDSSSGESDRKRMEHLKETKQRKKSNSSIAKCAQSNGHANNQVSTEVKSAGKSICNAKASKTKISDRIQFEDDLENNSSEGGTRETPATESPSELASESSQLRRYLKMHPGLRSVAPPAPVVGPADELWLVQVPSELEPAALHRTTLSLGEQCRVKVGRTKYEGHLQCDQHLTVPLLTSDNGLSVIQNIPIQGSVRFRRKIPVTQVTEENTMINNIMESIPLPETKCRHPLFGADYKKAIKLPSAVRKRLKATLRSAPAAKCTDAMDVADGEAAPETSHSEPLTRKKRKRPRDSDSGAPKRPRRASAHQWDSAQDIEQNLFSY